MGAVNGGQHDGIRTRICNETEQRNEDGSLLFYQLNYVAREWWAGVPTYRVGPGPGWVEVPALGAEAEAFCLGVALCPTELPPQNGGADWARTSDLDVPTAAACAFTSCYPVESLLENLSSMQPLRGAEPAFAV